MIQRTDNASGQMRIARALSLLGYCSRREAERLIAQRRVSVDGHLVDNPATLVDPSSQELRVDQKAVQASSGKRVYLAVHKPVGVTSTLRDPHAERTISELARGMGRLYPVGRLDKDSEGLILLTNDGEFANRVAHPRYGVSREYLAQVDALPNESGLRRLRHGVVLDGRRATPSLVEAGPRGPMPVSRDSRARGEWVRIVLREGRNREVRRMLGAVGCSVLRLVRTRIGPVRLAGLRAGQYRPLKPREIETLMSWSERSRVGDEEEELEIAVPVEELPSLRSSDGSQTVPDPRPPERRDPHRLVVAIDGPSAAGKTTVGRAVAQRVGANFLDTGVLYRALTLDALEHGIDVSDPNRLRELAARLDVRVEGDGGPGSERIFTNGRDITEAIRSEAVNANVSLVAAHSQVRAALVPAQRRVADGAAAVVVGRDIGTVIFPDADVKVFLDASPEERGRRRAREQAREAQREAVQTQLAERDEIDRTRAVAPLVPAADAVHIDTSGLAVDDVVERVLALIEQRRGAA